MDDTSNPPVAVSRVFFARSMLSHPEFKRAAKEMLALTPGFGTWGLVTGVAMVKAGVPPDLAFLMSVVVNAGSAQLAALPLIMSGAGIWIVLIAGLCVNLRFAIFSLQWRPYLVHFPWLQRVGAGYLTGDMSYVLFMRRFPSPQRDVEAQMPYLWGLIMVGWGAWQLMAIVGIVLADMIPVAWGLQFAAVLAIVAVMFSMLKGWVTWVTMGVAAFVVMFVKDVLPFDLNIVAAILTAVAAALVAEKADHLRRVREGLTAPMVAFKPTDVAEDDGQETKP